MRTLIVSFSFHVSFLTGLISRFAPVFVVWRIPMEEEKLTEGMADESFHHTSTTTSNKVNSR
jgi:hypothetical protein